MSIILKSNVAYTGDKKLKSVIPSVMTADQYFTAYKNRVIADGGYIVDETKTLATINFLFANDLISRSTSIVSSKYGLKLDGTKVVKLYGLDGVDLVAVLHGTGDYYTIDGTDGSLKPYTSTFSNANGCLYQSEKPVRIASKGKIAFISMPVVTSTPNANASAIMTYADSALGDIKAYGQQQITSNTCAWQVPTPASVQTGTSTSLTVGKLPLITYIDQKNRLSRIFKGSTQIYSNLQDLDPAILTLERYLQVGGRYYDVPSSSIDRSFSIFNLHAAWALFDFAENELLKISDHLQTIH